VQVGCLSQKRAKIRKINVRPENNGSGRRIITFRSRAVRVFVTAANHGQIDPAPTDPRPQDTGGQAASATRSEDQASRIDSAVVAGLYERYANELGLFLKGVLRNSDLAAEALQNTFAKAVESGHTAREESIKGWLFRVAFHEAALLRRRGQLHERSLRQMARDSQSRSSPLEPPDERVSRSEMLAVVRKALDELPPDQRQVVQMRIYEEKSFAEIADELSAPLGTVLTRMRLAMKKLSRQVRKPDR
jgi:RNA polymerase sigma factor (sigma-70 family)